jgi:hypothetical protein
MNSIEQIKMGELMKKAAYCPFCATRGHFAGQCPNVNPKVFEKKKKVRVIFPK